MNPSKNFTLLDLILFLLIGIYFLFVVGPIVIGIVLSNGSLLAVGIFASLPFDLIALTFFLDKASKIVIWKR